MNTSVLLLHVSCLICSLHSVSGHNLPKNYQKPRALLNIEEHSTFEVSCPISSERGVFLQKIKWRKDGDELNWLEWLPIKENGLKLHPSQLASKAYSGLYTCYAVTKNRKAEIGSIQLNVSSSKLLKSEKALHNISAHASTVIVTLRWSLHYNELNPVTKINVRYKLLKDLQWKAPKPSHHLCPSTKYLIVSQLSPNMSYIFKIWANYKFGTEESTTVHVTTLPPNEPKEWAKKVLMESENFNSTQALWIMTGGIFICTIIFLAIICCILMYIEGKISWLIPEYADDVNEEEPLTEISTNEVHVIENPTCTDQETKNKLVTMANNQKSSGATKNFIEISLNSPSYPYIMSVDV